MAILFICLVSALFASVDGSWSRWTTFELRVDEIETDPSLNYEDRAAFLQYYVSGSHIGRGGRGHSDSFG